MAHKRRIFNSLIADACKHDNKTFEQAVIQLKMQEANNIIRSGLRRQLSYIIEKTGVRSATELLNRRINDQSEILNLVSLAGNNGGMVSIDRAIYETKRIEGDKLMCSTTPEKVSYLVSQLGHRVVQDLVTHKPKHKKSNTKSKHDDFSGFKKDGIDPVYFG